jgi:5-methylcytosine-specific restriction endonuclease McrA
LISGRVLLLNFSYEPLGTVGVAKAICMWFTGKVTIEEFDGDNFLRSPSAQIRVPSVIRLRKYVHVHRHRQETTMKRARIYMRDNYRCQYCGEQKPAKDLTLDHIVPRSQGGESIPQNLVTACVKCNQRKGNRTPEQARMPLLTPQRILNLGLDRVLLCNYAESRPEWRKYLFLEEASSEKIEKANKRLTHIAKIPK